MAGVGTRLFPATKSQPKEMLPVGRKPVVQYVIEELRAAGGEQILLITGRKKAAIEDHFDADLELSRVLHHAGNVDPSRSADCRRDRRRLLYTARHAQRRRRRGGPGARLCRGEPFVVAFGDTIIHGGDLVARLMAAHRESGASGAVAVEQIAPEDAFRYGIVMSETSMARSWRSTWWRNRLRAAHPATWPSCRATFLSRPSSDAIEATRPGLGGERWLTDSIAILARESPPVRVVPLEANERRYDIGNFASYYRAFIDFALADPQYGAEVRQYVSELGQRL